ncbi:MAG: class I SAM-dependent methyltransferase [Chloroflexota bacterium]
MKHTDFNTYMQRIHDVFDVEAIVSENLSLQDTETYYHQSNLGYLFFHSWQGAVHMALSDSYTFKPEDYARQVQCIADDIRQQSAQTVLELGMGKGFNLRYLVDVLPEHIFYGLDYTTLHTQQSKQRLQNSHNAHVMRADFHHVPLTSNSVDYVFELESVCHALDVKQVLGAVRRVLRPNGTFTLFDGFRVVPMDALSPQYKIARHLVEKPLGVHEGTNISDFLRYAEELSFEVIATEDLSAQILPNLRRLQALQDRFFWHAFPLKVAKRLLPPYLVRNVIASMLMPHMVESGIQGYYKIILKARK